MKHQSLIVLEAILSGEEVEFAKFRYKFDKSSSTLEYWAGRSETWRTATISVTQLIQISEKLSAKHFANIERIAIDSRGR